jgi:hypothetical protein
MRASPAQPAGGRTPTGNPLYVTVKAEEKPWQEVPQLPVDRVQAAAALAVHIKTSLSKGV